jgi:hypothetical protein
VVSLFRTATPILALLKSNRARNAIPTQRTIIDGRAARNAIPTRRLIYEGSNIHLDSFDFDDGILYNADSDEGELELNKDDDVVGVERQPIEQLPIDVTHKNQLFRVTHVTHQLIIDDDDKPVPSLMSQTKEPPNKPADIPFDLPAALCAALRVSLPVDPPNAPRHNLSNGERANKMLCAREQKKNGM